MINLLSTGNIYHPFYFFGFIVALLFTNHLRDFMYDPPLFKLVL